MKALICELCGSHDIMKQEGYFVCQHCGVKYSPEEARKIVLEGKIDVSGSKIQIDQSEKISNLYLLARRALENQEHESALRYYDAILLEEPESWEAAFFSVYCKAKECRIGQICSAGKSLSNCLDTVLELIRTHVKEPDAKKKAVKKVASRSYELSRMLFSAARSQFEEKDSQARKRYIQETVERCAAARDILYTLGDEIHRLFPDFPALLKTAAEAWKEGVLIHQYFLPQLKNRSLNQKIILEYAEKIQQYDPEYPTPRFSLWEKLFPFS